MDIQQLITYIHQLETQNKQLQKHIFNIQQQLDQKNQIILLHEKKINQLNEYIKKCQFQIMKRQERQILLIQNIQELNKEIGVYVDEIQRMKKQSAGGNRSREIRDKQRYRDDKYIQSDMKVSGVKLMKLPPKSNQKCKNCQLLINDRDILIIELQKMKQNNYILSRDIQCIVGTFSTQ